ncbi:MAG: 4a-hydroxytetrahydrobiopterin dehydratase [Candidatus Omnitrophica bacterium]|nr:4a-hydroxytetrahydrobiopterin dehydratase [Candidatus Omnitrophota bacterium]
MPQAVKLSDTQVQEELWKTPGWELKEGEITRLYKFLDFKAALGFVNRVGELAEAADHHPDILILYNKVRLTISTHSAGGLTEKDFQLARRLDSP